MQVSKEIAEKVEKKSKVGRPPGPSAYKIRTIRLVQDMFREHANEALETMLRIMRDEDADKAVRLKAANDILNRGFGTPVSTQVIATIDGKEQGSTINAAALASTPTQDLVAAIELIKRFANPSTVEDAEVIDVTPEDDS